MIYESGVEQFADQAGGSNRPVSHMPDIHNIPFDYCLYNVMLILGTDFQVNFCIVSFSFFATPCKHPHILVLGWE